MVRLLVATPVAVARVDVTRHMSVVTGGGIAESADSAGWTEYHVLPGVIRGARAGCTRAVRVQKEKPQLADCGAGGVAGGRDALATASVGGGRTDGWGRRTGGWGPRGGLRASRGCGPAAAV